MGAPARAARAREGADLSTVLSSFGAERHIALLYDSALVAGLKAGSYRKDRAVDRVLADILRGTGLVAVRTASGAYVIQRETRKPFRPRPATSEPPTPIAEILVLGHSSSNLDLPRSVDDIQPYTVMSANRVDASLAHNTAELLSEQLTMNVAEPALLATDGRTGNWGFYVDLTGLEAGRTLITVDGRRMPGYINPAEGQQTDIGAISPGSIDRVESLGLAAGAIFGVDAAGGAVNVVLKHDFRGFEINMVNGISQRGDDAQHALEAKAGFESANGRTKAMIRVGFNTSGGVLLGARSVGERDLELAQQYYPADGYLVGNVLSYRSADGTPLQLSKAYGGASLGAMSTWLPVNAPALSAGGLATLIANAGKPFTGLSPDGQGALQSLLPARKGLSIMASGRQAVGDHVELYADILLLSDIERYNTATIQTYFAELYPGEPLNPFNNYVWESYPTPGLVSGNYSRNITDRETLGAIVRLPHGWSASLDFSRGEAATLAWAQGSTLNPIPLDLTGGPAHLASQLSTLSNNEQAWSDTRSYMLDANGRAAGPLFALPGGQATLTLIGEWLQYRQPGSLEDSSGEIITNGDTLDTVGSASAEARLPIISTDIGAAPWRGLKLQLAARWDRYVLNEPGAGTASDEINAGDPTRVENRGSVVSFTTGGSVEPLPGVMLRASYADGYEPPAPDQIQPLSGDASLRSISDPERGGSLSHDRGSFSYTYEGSSDYKAQRTRAIAVGIVFRPSPVPGLRLSLDYTRMLVTQVLTDFADGNYTYILQHEAEFPGRIVRAPLTAADAARGYTGGVIESIDAAYLPIGRDTIHSLQGSVDYRHSLGTGVVQAYGRANWEPKFAEQTDPDFGAVNLAGLLVGPLKWRGNAGVGWASARWSAELDAQYYGSYRNVAYDDNLITMTEYGTNSPLIEAPGLKIGGKAYFDLALGYTTHMGLGPKSPAIRYRLAIRNLFDKAAIPLASDLDNQQADPYSDLIGRRFELGVSFKY